MKIEQFPDLPIVYMRRTGKYGVGNNQLMDRFKHWMGYNNASHTNLFTDNAVVLGIIRDNPALVPPKECRYDTALVLSAQQEINDECVQHDILQGGSYAIFTIHHTAEALNEAWEVVFNKLAETGHQLDTTRLF